MPSKENYSIIEFYSLPLKFVIPIFLGYITRLRYKDIIANYIKKRLQATLILQNKFYNSLRLQDSLTLKNKTTIKIPYLQ